MTAILRPFTSNISTRQAPGGDVLNGFADSLPKARLIVTAELNGLGWASFGRKRRHSYAMPALQS